MFEPHFTPILQIKKQSLNDFTKISEPVVDPSSNS